MQFPTTTLLLTSLAASVFADDMATCHNKNPDVVAAIQKFCSSKTLMAPSTDALLGVMVGQVRVQIDGHRCKPAQWIPQRFCLSQFYHMCAVGKKNGENLDGTKFGYGKDVCQEWFIQVGLYDDPRVGFN